MKSERLSLRQAIAWVLLSVLFVSVPAALGLSLYQYIRYQRYIDPTYNIQYVAADALGGQQLPQKYLEQLLGLAVDVPTNLYLYSSKEATEALLRDPLIKEAQVHKLTPNTLIVEYRVREPIALLGDYQNTAVDSEGMQFPNKPFFQKNLPTIYLRARGGEHSSPAKVWGESCQGHKFDLASAVLSQLNQLFPEAAKTSTVDVAQATALSCGQRQIVVSFSETVVSHAPIPCYLRLSCKHYASELANYQKLRMRLQKDVSWKSTPNHLMVDLRIPQLGFLSY